jgi:hypothetical protein
MRLDDALLNDYRAIFQVMKKLGFADLCVWGLYVGRAWPDDAMLAAGHALRKEGLALEPASAAPVVCAQAMAQEHQGIGKAEACVAIGAGAAIKWPHDIVAEFRMPRLSRRTIRTSMH